jgi:hypothetical protein
MKQLIEGIYRLRSLHRLVCVKKIDEEFVSTAFMELVSRITLTASMNRVFLK